MVVVGRWDLITNTSCAKHVVVEANSIGCPGAVWKVRDNNLEIFPYNNRVLFGSCVFYVDPVDDLRHLKNSKLGDVKGWNHEMGAW